MLYPPSIYDDINIELNDRVGVFNKLYDLSYNIMSYMFIWPFKWLLLNTISLTLLSSSLCLICLYDLSYSIMSIMFIWSFKWQQIIWSFWQHYCCLHMWSCLRCRQPPTSKTLQADLSPTVDTFFTKNLSLFEVQKKKNKRYLRKLVVSWVFIYIYNAQAITRISKYKVVQIRK